ncbi:MAG: hypothetical protein ACD_60C00133G0009 [uncultured bacterium]|nr:MAG: hypothetical protein ACD_60C00133G0009 [uncultured bacterium]
MKSLFFLFTVALLVKILLLFFLFLWLLKIKKYSLADIKQCIKYMWHTFKSKNDTVNKSF